MDVNAWIHHQVSTWLNADELPRSHGIGVKEWERKNRFDDESIAEEEEKAAAAAAANAHNKSWWSWR